MTMSICPSCGANISELEPYCPYCGKPNPTKKAGIKRKVDEYRKKRKRVLATFVLGMIGIAIIPFFRLVLAIISMGIAFPMSVYYSWKKYQLEKELED